MKKIFFLTRSLYPYQKTGGGQIRAGQINFLKQLDYDITVVMPNYSSKELIVKDSIIQMPILYNIRLASYLERLGFYEDYFDKWVVKSFEYLKNMLQKEDVVFATSGGELGMIKIGSLLKNEIGCKFIVNFHDPLDYSIVNDLRLDKKFHVNREKQEKKYLKNSDLIITSSKSNQISLQRKYPRWKDKIINNYFGYINQIELKKRDIVSKKIKIAYVGNMGELQQPEILYHIYKKINRDDIEIYFIGDSKSYKPLQNIKDENIYFIDYLPHNKFLEFMTQNIDIGFVSLANDYLGACVPSKIYEYINLALPMLGALPDGDGRDIINKNNYGIAYRYNDIDGLSRGMSKLIDIEYLQDIKSNILKDRDSWFMKERIIEIDTLLRDLSDEN
jgi:glycosyltransferase involved in cell wall biosynthesis